MPRPTVIYWANTQLSVAFSATFSPGIAPSTFEIYTVPHVDDLPNVGDLTFYTKDDNGDPIQLFEFPDCLLESPKLNVSPSGNYVTLPILDRRWKWRWGTIKGSYNVPQPDGISLLRELDPQAMAALLLFQMGETDWDISRLPTDDNSRPHVEWDSANPAVELDRLCQELGCIVVLNPFTNRVEVWPVGEGRGDPDPPFTTAIPYKGYGSVPVYPGQPKKIIKEAAATLFDMVFKTEAVGKDTDGTWKRLDDLSYKPAEGWEKSWSPRGFQYIVEGTYTEGGQTLQKHDLANATVFRCYRVTGLVGAEEGAPWCPPLLLDTEYEPATFKDLRLFDSISAYDISGEDGSIVPLPAVIYTKRMLLVEDEKPENDPRFWPYGFQFDTVHGVVTFPVPVLLTEDGKEVPATVRIRTAFYAGKDGVYHRHSVEADTDSTIETPSRVDKHKEIQRIVMYPYDNTTDALEGSDPTDNEQDCTDRLTYWLEEAQKEYGLRQGGTIEYPSLEAISPDGLIQQVSWSGGVGREPKTIASAAQRHDRYVPPLDNQRHGLRFEPVAQGIDRIDKALRSVAAIDRQVIA